MVLPEYDDAVSPRYPMLRKVSREVSWFLLDVKDAFERKDVRQLETEEGEVFELDEAKKAFGPAQLRRDLKRCFASALPFLEMAAAGYDLLLWKSPITTLLLTLVYMYSIWVGYFWTLFFGLILLQLSFNYLYTVRGIDIGLSFLPRRSVRLPSLDINSTKLIIELAKLAQQLVTFAADVLEKLDSLLTWKAPEVTFHFYCLVIYWLVLATVFNTGTCFGMCGMTFGVRLFITTYLFDRFPRLRYRLDTYGYFYRNLPIKNGEMRARSLSTDSRLFPSSGRSSVNNLNDAISPRHSSTYSLNTESDIQEEDSVEDVLDHRRCTMNDKAKGFPRNYAQGTLNLTSQALIFRSSTLEERMIRLSDIASIKEILSLRSLSLMTGSRKGIELRFGNETILFLGISQREAFVKAIQRACIENGYSPIIVSAV